MKYRTRKVSTFDVDGMEAELSFEPSSVMSYVDHVVEKRPGLVAVGYLVDDSDVDNPLEDCDGMGHIYSSHRHSGKHAEMQAALGLDSDWRRDYSLVEEDAEKALLERVKTEFRPDMVRFVLECVNDEGMSPDEASRHFVSDFTGQYPYHAETWLTQKVRERMNWQSFLDEAWEAGRSAGKVGNPFTVTLDCYEHGGQVWSISGTGMQCPFDTSRGVGVWVPDQTLRQELDDIESAEGHEAARSKAVEFARQALASYNAWLSGDCYGVAVDVFSIEGERLKRVNDSAVWGYIGREWAEQAMKEEVTGMIEHSNLSAA